MSATNTKAASRPVQFRARPDDMKHIAEIQHRLRRIGVSSTATDAIRYALGKAARDNRYSYEASRNRGTAIVNPIL